MTYGDLENISHQCILLSSVPWYGEIKNFQADFDHYISSSALPLPPPQALVLFVSPQPPRLQCSTVFNNFKSPYCLHFQISKNGSIFTFSLYKTTMPPQAEREQEIFCHFIKLFFSGLIFYIESNFACFSFFF